MGLTVIEVNARAKTKFNTLRTHLGWPDHPIVGIMQNFRESLVAYISERLMKINTSAKYYNND